MKPRLDYIFRKPRKSLEPDGTNARMRRVVEAHAKRDRPSQGFLLRLRGIVQRAYQGFPLWVIFRSVSAASSTGKAIQK
jgi:hypothetical protein